MRDGKAVHIEGDPDSPVSRGRLCPKGAGTLQLTTGPARLYQVLQRRPHGTDGEAVPLEEAVDMVAGGVVQEDICKRLQPLRSRVPYGVTDKRPGDGRIWKCTIYYDCLGIDEEPACANACPTDSIQSGVNGPLDELGELSGAMAPLRALAPHDSGLGPTMLHVDRGVPMTVDAVPAWSRGKAVETVWVTAVDGQRRSDRPDQVVGEEPLEIRMAGPGWTDTPVAVTMRTPGNDFELAVGFLLSEGLVVDPAQVRAVRYCAAPDSGPQLYNVVSVSTSVRRAPERLRRAVTVTASCGICGTATLDQLYQRCQTITAAAPIRAAVLAGLPGQLRARQRVFEKTGGLHAAGLFDGDSGAALAVREDIGRHNAVDKLLGWAALNRRLPLSAAALVVSGRVSFEIVQKAAIAGIPILAAVSAPSSLAVATARRLGMTLAAFVRDGRATVYSCPERVVLAGHVEPASPPGPI